MSLPKIILVGAGGHCRSCMDVIEAEGQFEIAGVVDRAEAVRSEPILGYPVLGSDDDLGRLRERFPCAMVTVGQIKTPAVRIRLFEQLRALGYELPAICSPRAWISPHARVGAGTIVMHDALINAGATVGENCIVNSKALVEHDVTVEAHCHVSTGAILNGGARVGAGSFIGSHATCFQGAVVPAGSVVPAGHLERGR